MNVEIYPSQNITEINIIKTGRFVRPYLSSAKNFGPIGMKLGMDTP